MQIQEDVLLDARKWAVETAQRMAPGNDTPEDIVKRADVLFKYVSEGTLPAARTYSTDSFVVPEEA